MATLDASALCKDLEIDIDLDLDPLVIPFPGGLELSAQLPHADIQLPLDVAKQAFAQINAALLPLAPIFTIIDAVLAVFEIIKSIPDAIKPPDPGKISRKIAQVEAKLDKLLRLLPPVTIPALIKALLHVMIVFLTGVRDQLASLVTLSASIDASQAAADALLLLPHYPGTDISIGFNASAELLASVTCARATIAAQLKGHGQANLPFNRLVDVVNFFGNLVELPQIPKVAAFDANIGVNIQPLDDLITTLTEIRSTIP